LAKSKARLRFLDTGNMPTVNQLVRKSRQRPQTKSKVPALAFLPQKRACARACTRHAEKPNSALRKVAKVRSQRLEVISYIGARGHNCRNTLWWC